MRTQLEPTRRRPSVALSLGRMFQACEHRRGLLDSQGTSTPTCVPATPALGSLLAIFGEATPTFARDLAIAAAQIDEPVVGSSFERAVASKTKQEETMSVQRLGCNKHVYSCSHKKRSFRGTCFAAEEQPSSSSSEMAGREEVFQSHEKLGWGQNRGEGGRVRVSLRSAGVRSTDPRNPTSGEFEFGNAAIFSVGGLFEFGIGGDKDQRFADFNPINLFDSSSFIRIRS